MDIDWTDVLLKTVLVLLVVLLVGLIAYGVDQSFAKETFVGNATVTERHFGIRTTFIYVNKIMIPQTFPYWELSFNLNGTEHSADVSEACYSHINVGDSVGIDMRTGLFSVGYYPIC